MRKVFQFNNLCNAMSEKEEHFREICKLNHANLERLREYFWLGFLIKKLVPAMPDIDL